MQLWQEAENRENASTAHLTTSKHGIKNAQTNEIK